MAALLRDTRNTLLSRQHALELKTIRDMPLDPHIVKKVAGVSRLAEMHSTDVHEVTTDLLLDQALLAEELRYSLEHNCLMWVLVVEDNLTLAELDQAFPSLIHRLGPPLDDGACAHGVSVAALTCHLLDMFPDMARAFDGIDTTRLARGITERLYSLKTPVRKRGAVSRLLRNPKFYIYLMVLAYSALRALPVTFIEGFRGSIAVLWGIDMVTALPYTWGVLAMVTASKRSTRFWGTLTTIVTFISPYLYFWWYGRSCPPYVTVIIAGMVCDSIAMEAWKFRQEKVLHRRYRESAGLLVPSVAHSGPSAMHLQSTKGSRPEADGQDVLPPAPLSLQSTQ